RLTRLLQDEARLQELFTTSTAADLIEALGAEAAPPAIPQGPVSELSETFEWVVDYPSGLHARPASQWVEAARRFPAQAQVRFGDQLADAKSLVSLLQLGLRQGDKITLSTEGRDAAAALAALRRVV